MSQTNRPEKRYFPACLVDLLVNFGLKKTLSPLRVADRHWHVPIDKQDLLALGTHLVRHCGARFVTLVGTDERDLGRAFALYHVYFCAADGAYVTLSTALSEAHPGFPSIALEVPAANWAEREVQDLFGFVPVGHPDARRLVLFDDWPQGVFPLSKELQGSIKSMFARSLHVRVFDAGSCNGCEIELAQLLAPQFDLQQYGIDFVASPRHADALIVTGPVTRHLEAALRATYEAMGDPKIVLAMGACGINGGLFADAYGTVGGVDQVLPVDVYIPGCPPQPLAIIQGLLIAMGRAEHR